MCDPNSRYYVLGLSFVLVLFSNQSPAFVPMHELLQVKEYVSPSGEYRFRVDPGNRHGAGKAKYLLTHKGRELWSGERPFTLWDAGVADDGTVGGYAYSLGLQSWFTTGEFRVVILDPLGATRLEHVTKRETSRFLHMHGSPLAEGLIFDPPNDRMIVRVRDADVNRGVESWWVYQLSAAKAAGTFEPETIMPVSEDNRSILHARPVPGTPLTLLQWWVSRSEKQKWTQGALFTLIDKTGRPVWTRDLPADYTRPGDDAAEDQLRSEMVSAGAILEVTPKGEFSLRFVTEGQRVTFGVRRGADDKWDVREMTRSPYVPKSRTRNALSPVPKLNLTHVGTVPLRSTLKNPSGPVHSVRTFVLDGSGRVAFLRGEPGAGAVSFVLLSPTGALVREVPVKNEKLKGQWLVSQLAWVGGDRFLVTQSTMELDAKATAQWIDGKSGEVTNVEGFDCPSVDKLAGFPDGRFVTLATQRSRNTSTTTAYLFDAKGKRVHTFRQGYEETAGLLFSPTDLAVTTEGHIGVLDVIRANVSVFSSDGTYRKTIDLAQSWKRKPNYASDLAADVDGGFVVGDFNGSPPVVRMKPDGRIRQEFTVKFRDGRTSSSMQHVRVGPDGRMWASDGEAILRLDGSGVVDMVWGASPDPGRMANVAAVRVDSRGRIYAVDARSAAVHVFDPDGTPVYLCRPLPEDFATGAVSIGLDVTDAGHAYLTSLEREGEYLHFSPEGKRLGFVRLGKEQGSPAIAEHWLHRPDGTGRWVLDYDRIRIVDEAGRLARVIERTPEGLWVQSMRHGCVGPDGSLAAINVYPFSEERDLSIHLFDPKGEPIRTVKLSPYKDFISGLAFDGEYVALGSGNQVALATAAGRVLGVFHPKEGPNPKTNWVPFLRPKQKELWLFDGVSTIHRYQLPGSSP
jgi:sugar lactone lactonase YvrE